MLRSIRLVSLFVIPSLSVVACSSGAPDAPPVASSSVQVDSVEVVHGIPSRGRDPAVVAIDINGEGLCSGTLIAPRAVLTARHCVSKTTEEVACPPEGRQITEDRPPSSLRILVGDDVSSSRRVARGEEIVVPPSPVLCDHDIAIIVLDTDVDGIDPLPLADHATAKGDHVRAVGFGRVADGSSAGTKLYREHVRVLETSDDEFLVGEATCQGDSGGPAIDEESGAVVGVVSRGGPTCDGPGVHNIYTRVDVFRPLVEDALARAGKGSAPPDDVGDGGVQGRSPTRAKHAAKPKKPSSDVGSACTAAADCAAGVCVTAGDTRYCSRACGNGDRCPAGYHCKASTPSSQSVCIQK